MEWQTYLNIARPLICTATAGGLLYSGVQSSIVGKAAIVALAVYPIFRSWVSEPNPKGIEKNWPTKVSTFGVMTVMGTAGWLALESNIVSAIALFVLSFRSDSFHPPPFEVFRYSSLILLSLAGCVITYLNVGLAVEAYSKG